MTGLHFHSLQVRDVRPDTDDSAVVTFELPRELAETFRFEAGQYLTLRCAAAGEDLRRSYSICSAPGEALRVGIRHVPGGAFSGWVRQALKPGDRLDVMQPQGRFGAALARQPRRLLAVAGGAGITPILSLLRSALRDGAHCTLLYANRSSASTMFKEELEDLKNRYLTKLAVHAVFSREAVDSPLNNGRLDAAKVGAFLKLAGPVDEVFVCGPHAMNDEVEAALVAGGIAPGRIHIERFGVPPAEAARTSHAPQAGDAATARITIVRDGLAREVPFGDGDESILAAAARAGLDVPYSCKSGVCATCRAKLVEGQVRMDRNFALEPDDLAAGFVLTCQSHPLTERVTVSFDER
jgi:ring-1,2-phenylacetyl-CoA epoxidase subunit PaaE